MYLYFIIIFICLFIWWYIIFSKNEAIKNELKFIPGKPLKYFQEILEKKNIDIQDCPPKIAFDSMIDFYRNIGIKNCDETFNDDMILFQYGIYSYTGKEFFHFSVNRELKFGARGNRKQLSLCFYYEPINELKLMGEFVTGCKRRRKFKVFEEEYENNNIWKVIENFKPVKVELDFDIV